VLDNFSTGRWENLSAVQDRIEVMEADIRDPQATQQAMDGVGVVAHLAAIVSVERSLQNPQETAEVNTGGTLNLLEAARQAGVHRFLFASSAAVYGNHSQLPLQEELPPHPLSPYAASKVAGEAFCQAYHAAYGLSTVVLRFFNIYGPRQDPQSPYSGVISIFVGRMQQGLPPVIYGDGRQTRDFVYVGDVVAALIRAGEQDGADGTVLNVARGEETSVLQLVALLNQALGTHLEPMFAPARAGEVRRSAGDPRRAQAVLRWQPTIGLTEGLSRLIRTVSC
jgi:UDP-glucose 4-epimerase